jgi:hypothetical protein
MKQRLAIFSLFLGLSAFAQTKSAQDFLLDQSKPYVYLKFDHIGARKPIQDGEGEVGLWLRVVNNCRIPIVFQSFGMSDGGPGVGLMDEVVETEPMLQIYSTAEEGEKIQQHGELRKSKHKPDGYSSEVSGVARVQPGTDILFSVPLNHVDEDWYMRVKFALDLGKSSVAVGPFTYLPFYEWDIPKELRPAGR